MIWALSCQDVCCGLRMRTFFIRQQLQFAMPIQFWINQSCNVTFFTCWKWILWRPMPGSSMFAAFLSFIFSKAHRKKEEEKMKRQQLKNYNKKMCNYLTSISFKDETKQGKTTRMPIEKKWWWLRWWSGERFDVRKKQINRLTTLQMGCWNLCWLFCSFRILYILIQLLHWQMANSECICMRLYTSYIVAESLMDDRYFIIFREFRGKMLL